MPYCEAAVLEGVRMFMGYTFGIPHRALRDTKFRGYNIPKVNVLIPPPPPPLFIFNGHVFLLSRTQ